MIKNELKNVDITEIVPYPNNPRKNDNAVDGVAKSLNEFGLVKNSIVVDENNILITGHTTLKAMQKLGWETIPEVTQVEGLTEEQKKAYRIADNKTGEIATWDCTKLEIELIELNEAFDIDISDMIDLTGFCEKDLSSMLSTEPQIEELLPEPSGTPLCTIGDLWLLGSHRLLCGDATNEEDVQRLMEDKKADLVFTDPPYGVNYASKNAFLNEIDEGNRIQVDICGDHQSALEMKNLWTITFKLMYEYSRVGACYYICSPQGGELMMMMMMSIKEAGWNLKHTIVWVKNNFVLGRSDYNYKHEPLLYGWKDTSHKFYGGTNETSVWEIDKLHRSDLHPTMKPVELVTRALTNSSVPGETVIDFFLGSGTTLVACEQLNRVCYGIELTPHYCDVILSRWAKLTDKDPVRDDGIKWSEL